jgi:hypothetical protein
MAKQKNKKFQMGTVPGYSGRKRPKKRQCRWSREPETVPEEFGKALTRRYSGKA